MAEPARSDVDVRPGGVVRPLSRAATRRCSRPGCPAPATATLAFRYEDRHATLIPLATDGGPETYDLCGDHADRTNPPHGWTLEDGRPEEVAVEAPTVDTLGSERTVAVLAAALRGDAPTPEAVAVDRDHGASTDVTDVEATGDAEPAIDPAPEPTGVDVAALDAIVDQPFDEPDLFGTVDEADPVVGAPSTAPSDALDELSALSSRERVEDPHARDGAAPSTPPARTVPGARRAA
jgi:hypothetical protein